MKALRNIKHTNKKNTKAGLLQTACLVALGAVSSAAVADMPKMTEFIPSEIAAQYCETGAFSKQDILNYINQIRTTGVQCEGKYFPATHPVSWNDKLTNAAKKHSDDMARFQFVDHKGSDGSLPEQRVDNAGYHWYNLTENVASGTRSLAGTLDAFTKSAYHCENIMNTKVKEIGMACTYNPQSDQALYWSQLFASR